MKHLRERAGWTQAQLATTITRLGFDFKRVTIAEVERGGRRISLEELLAFAALFGQPVAMLLLPGYLTREPADLVNFPLDRKLDPRDVAALVLGPDGKVQYGNHHWQSPQRVAGVTDADDWRPAPDLDKNGGA